MSTKSTSNYGWFKQLSNNRKISKAHLNNLRKQFEEFGNITEISPITVNKHGFIIDGQHRKILCEEFGLPIYYNEVDVKKELTPAINANKKPWTSMDFVDFFYAYRPEYVLLSQFMTKNGIAYHIAMSVLFPGTGSATIHKKVVDGKLEVSGYLEEAQKRMDIVHEINELMGDNMTERYVRGLLRCLYMDKFDVERFISKLKALKENGSELPRPRTTTMLDTLRNIEAIYNYRTSSVNAVMLFR